MSCPGGQTLHTLKSRAPSRINRHEAAVTDARYDAEIATSELLRAVEPKIAKCAHGKIKDQTRIARRAHAVLDALAVRRKRVEAASVQILAVVSLQPNEIQIRGRGKLRACPMCFGRNGLELD